MPEPFEFPESSDPFELLDPFDLSLDELSDLASEDDPESADDLSESDFLLSALPDSVEFPEVDDSFFLACSTTFTKESATPGTAEELDALTLSALDEDALSPNPATLLEVTSEETPESGLLEFARPREVAKALCVASPDAVARGAPTVVEAPVSPATCKAADFADSSKNASACMGTAAVPPDFAIIPGTSAM